LEYRKFGKTGLTVSRLCLGTMTFGLQTEENVSRSIMDRAAEAGVNFIDTADVYPLGADETHSGRTEEIVGRWLKDTPSRRGEFIRAHRASTCWMPSMHRSNG
jgi:aryl-alcohol dehydrogenase-like predicted oxidoreductase